MVRRSILQVVTVALCTALAGGSWGDPPAQPAGLRCLAQVPKWYCRQLALLQPPADGIVAPEEGVAAPDDGGPNGRFTPPDEQTNLPGQKGNDAQGNKKVEGPDKPTTLLGQWLADLGAWLDGFGTLRVAAIFFIFGSVVGAVISYLLFRRHAAPPQNKAGAEPAVKTLHTISVPPREADPAMHNWLGLSDDNPDRAGNAGSAAPPKAELPKSATEGEPVFRLIDDSVMTPEAVEPAPVQEDVRAYQPEIPVLPSMDQGPLEAVDPHVPPVEPEPAPLPLKDERPPAYEAATASQLVKSIAAELNLASDETRRLVDGVFMHRDGQRAAEDFFQSLSRYRGDSEVTGRWGLAEPHLERFLEYCFHPGHATLIAPRRNSPYEPMDVIDVTRSLTGGRSRVGKLLVPGFRAEGITVKAVIESM